MIAARSFKILCVLTFWGLHASAREIDGSRENFSAFQPFIRWNNGLDDDWCNNGFNNEFPHPDWCDLVLRCDGAGILWSRHCGANEFEGEFDVRTWQCVPAGQAECYVRPDILPPIIPPPIIPPPIIPPPIIVPDNGSTTCPARFIGRIPHPNDCSLYYICFNGKRMIGKCLPFFRFDMDSRRCVHRPLARCMNNMN